MKALFCCLLLSIVTVTASAQLTGTRIGVDAGHGGTESGAVGPTGLREKDVNLSTALALQSYLVADGASVFMTRVADVTTEPSYRTTYLNSQGVNRVISVHHNGTGDTTTNRTMNFVYCGYCSSTASNLATKVVNRVATSTGLTKGPPASNFLCPGQTSYSCGITGVGQANLFMVRDTAAPATLVEVSFITSSTEETKLRSSDYLDGNAWAIYAGVADHYGVNPKPRGGGQTCNSLALLRSPSNGGTITADPIGTVPCNFGYYLTSTHVTLTAWPESGYQFTGWTASGGSLSTTSQPTTVFTITNDAQVTAMFSLTRIIRLEGNLAFGNVPVGGSSTKTLTIYNDGTSTLNVSGINFPSRFSGNWSGGSIAAGSSKSVSVTFAPTSATSYNGTITVDSDKTSGTSSISCSGTGVSSATRIIRLSGDLSFGTVTVGQSSVRQLTIYNDGNASLSVSSIAYPSGFTGDWSGGTIGAGNWRVVDVTFAPTSAASYGGAITVSSDKTSGTNTIACSGTGGAVSTTRIIRLTGDLAFGNVAPGQTAVRALTIHNDGDGTLTVFGISYPTGFSGDWSGGAIGAGGAKAVNVTFAPTSAASYSGTITVSSDKTSGTTTISCSGNGTFAGQAVYDPVLKAPKCATIGSTCDSGSLLRGRAGLGPEPNAPNTIWNSCGDGLVGTYQADESNERLKIISTDGGSFAPGKDVRIEATVWAFDASDVLDLYYTADVQNPSWLWIATFGIGGSGSQSLATIFTIPSGSALHAVRANFRYQGSPSSCTSGSYDDHDDLAFAVNNALPGMTVTPTSGLVTTEAGQTSQFTVVLNSQPSAIVSMALSSSDTTEGTETPTTLSFTTSNWNSPQSVTVTGVDDATHDGNIAYTVVTAPAVSADASYNGLNAPDVLITNIDNDPLGAPSLTAGFTGSAVAVSWSPAAGAARYELQRSYNTAPFGPIYSGSLTSMTDAGCPTATTCVYRVRAVDATETASAWTLDLATTVTFSDLTLLGTAVKAIHFSQLRTAVNSVRAAAGRPLMDFGGSVSIGVVVAAARITELRAALDEARAVLGVPPLSYSSAATARISRIRAADILEIRSGTQ